MSIDSALCILPIQRKIRITQTSGWARVKLLIDQDKQLFESRKKIVFLLFQSREKLIDSLA